MLLRHYKLKEISPQWLISFFSDNVTLCDEQNRDLKVIINVDIKTERKKIHKMNTATQNLENDHVYILRLTEVMEKMVLKFATDLSDMELMVKLIQQYADGFHHAKEENLLFPLMLEKGFSNEQGPISVMLQDHAQGRNFVKGMVAEITRYKAGDDSVLPELYRNMQGYVDLLRAHIGKENNVLFRMADRVLSPAEQEHLLSEFATMEEKNFGKGKVQEFITEIEGLEVKIVTSK